MKKLVLTLAICLFNLFLFGQSKFNVGFSIERGIAWGSIQNEKWEPSYKRYIALAIPFRYNLNDRLDFRSTLKFSLKEIDISTTREKNYYSDINRNNFGAYELISGIDISLIRKDHLKLIYTPAVNFTYTTSKGNKYGRCFTDDSINYFAEISQLKITNPFHISLSNSIRVQLYKQWEIGVSLNSGFYPSGVSKSDIIPTEKCSGYSAPVPDNFMDDPDLKIQNSYLSFSITYWPVRGEERKRRDIEYNLNRKNAFYAEILGAMFYYSLNYDRILLSTASKNINFRITGRVGINYMDMFDTTDVNTLTGISFLLGYRNHYAELGGGVTQTFHETERSIGYTFIGYRKQKDWLFARAGINMLFLNNGYDGNILPWPSFGMGIAF